MFGDDVAQLGGDRRRRFAGVSAWCFKVRLLDHLSALDNVALPLRINGGRDEQIRTCVSDMLKWLGLGDVIGARPPVLSMGQRQLVSVARGDHAPSLLLCDEPSNNIDGKLAGQLMHLFAQLCKLGTTVILATHSEDLVERYPHPVVRLAAGRLSGPVQPASALAAAD